MPVVAITLEQVAQERNHPPGESIEHRGPRERREPIGEALRPPRLLEPEQGVVGPAVTRPRSGRARARALSPAHEARLRGPCQPVPTRNRPRRSGRAAADHAADDGRRHVREAAESRRHDLVPVLLRHEREEAVARHAGVGDERVRRAELRDERRERSVPLQRRSAMSNAVGAGEITVNVVAPGLVETARAPVRSSGSSSPVG